MKSVPRPLLWEIIRYEPKLHFTFEILDKVIQKLLYDDIDYFYFFIKEIFKTQEPRK